MVPSERALLSSYRSSIVKIMCYNLNTFENVHLLYIGGSQPHPKLQSKIAGKRVHIEE